jgi:hypothetical protein
MLYAKEIPNIKPPDFSIALSAFVLGAVIFMIGYRVEKRRVCK